MPIEVAGLELNPCAWIPESVPELQLRIVLITHSHIGIEEMPPGSNRSPFIDRINKKWGAPVGSYWCASFVAEMFDLAGAQTPKVGLAPSCDEWVKFAKKNGTWVATADGLLPEVGWAVVYGKPRPFDANHIGIISRNSPIVRSIEGNTSTGGQFERNGTAVWPKTPSSKVLGYCKPIAKVAV